MRITERCGCGASIEAAGTEFDHLGDLAAVWRSDHRHDSRCPTSTESDEHAASGGMCHPDEYSDAQSATAGISTTASVIERDEPPFGFCGESVVTV